jgi:hypothetical protein
MRVERVRVRYASAAVKETILRSRFHLSILRPLYLVRQLEVLRKGICPPRLRELFHKRLGLVFARLASCGSLRGIGAGLSAEIKSEATSHGRDLPRLGFALSQFKGRTSQVLHRKDFSSGVVCFVQFRLRLLSTSGSGCSVCRRSWK